MKDLGQIKLLHLFLQPTRQARVHRAPAAEDDVLVEVLSDVDRAGLDGLEEQLGHTGLLDVH